MKYYSFLTESFNTNKIIFLDIDGVMNDFEPPTHISKVNISKRNNYIVLGEGISKRAGIISFMLKKDYVENLKTILRRTNASIVISSSWRNRPQDWTEFCKIIGVRNVDRTPYSGDIGLTDALLNRYGKGQGKVFGRLIEILYYVKHNNVSKYVILDNMDMNYFKDEFPSVIEHFVCTDNNVYGLTSKLVPQVISKLI